MDTNDLLAELRAAWAAMNRDHRTELIAAGILVEIIELYPLIGTASVRLQGRLYEPAPDGRPAYITPVLVADPASPETPAPGTYACHLGEIVDLVAWHPAYPERWALRVGAASWLGCIEPQYMDPEPVCIRRSPLAWLRAGCDGLAILSRDPADAYRLLTGCARLVAEDRTHATELRRLVRQPWPLPGIAVAEHRDAQ